MNPERWKRALAPTAACPDLSELAAFASGPMEESTGWRIASHVRNCARCATELSLVDAYLAEPPREAAVDWVVARLEKREREITGATAPRRLRSFPGLRFAARPAGALLVAAGVLLAVGAGVLYQSQSRAPALSAPVGSRDVLRSNGLETLRPSGELAEAPAELSWREVDGAARYRVMVMEVDRSELWRAEVRGTTAVLPAGVRARCVPGKALLWQVLALDERGQRVGASGLERFRVAPSATPVQQVDTTDQ